MVLNIIKTAALSLAFGWALPVSAQPMETPGETYGQLGLGLPQATGYAARNGFRSEANFEPMRRYRASSRLGPLIRYVGYLDVKTAAGKALKCTATLIAADRLLTNAHCYPERGPARAISAQFQLGYLSVLDKDSARRFAVKGAVLRHDRMDYAVLTLDRAVPGWVDPGWQVRAPRRDEPLLVVGHPLAQPLHVTQAGCVATAGFGAGAQELLHSCDTEQGSSGALLFSADDPKQIVGLHKEWTSEGNRALRLTALDWAAFVGQGRKTEDPNAAPVIRLQGQGSGALYADDFPVDPQSGAFHVDPASSGAFGSAPPLPSDPKPSARAPAPPLTSGFKAGANAVLRRSDWMDEPGFGLVRSNRALLKDLKFFSSNTLKAIREAERLCKVGDGNACATVGVHLETKNWAYAVGNTRFSRRAEGAEEMFFRSLDLGAPMVLENGRHLTRDTVLGLQKLYNAGAPSRRLTEDGQWGPGTRASLAKMCDCD
ncbi:trypsin-like serine peptidase [Pacificoceanicola onchidii]|uniref:trypsin-like serine peptidase n=1 Tax=Pacificoceanicola onchidii TaxID=2562685 RepID=UPI0010A5B058|nr:serine protease [Pacificoceanicola onchidii]